VIAGIFGIIFLFAAHFLVKWREDENIDNSSGELPGGAIGSEVNRGTRNRKNKKRSKLEAEVRRSNKEHSNRMFYRDGPRVKEYTSEEVAAIKECERLNAQYTVEFPHYFFKRGRVEYGEEIVNRYKFEAKMREINKDFDNGISCDLDRRNMKLFNTVTAEEIPFNPDSYTLPPSHFRG